MQLRLNYILILFAFVFSLKAQQSDAQFQRSLDSLAALLKTAAQDTNRVKLLIHIANRNKNFDP